jgi:ATP-dependent RNA helicase HelY
VGLANELRKLQEASAGYLESMECHLGDFAEYAEIRNAINRVEKTDTRSGVVQRKTEADTQLRSLTRGDVIVLGNGKKSGPAVVLSAASTNQGEEPKPVVMTADKQIRRLNHHDGLQDLQPIGFIKIPKSFVPKDQKRLQESITAQIRSIAAERVDDQRRIKKSQRVNPAVQELRDRMKAHPCHGCSDRESHARWGERYYKIQGQISEIQGRMQGRTNTISKRFDRLCDVLLELGYLNRNLDGELSVTPPGQLLKGIYSESDLLVAQCIRSGVLNELDPPALAAVCSAFLYESRRSEIDDMPSVPGGPTEKALEHILRIWGELQGVEHHHRLNTIRRIDAGLAWAVYRWAKGATLLKILTSNDVTAGDFVRWIRQVIDLLGQIVAVTDPDTSLHQNANKAIDLIQRGVISYPSNA